jgi:DNA-binding GntR family transcriptional regulator
MSLTAPSAAGLNTQGRVIAEMRRRIIAGELRPGASLSEITLAESFGVSRTPVREALKQLETEGLVHIRPRVGTFVTAPSRREIIELFELKELLEGAAARLVANNGSVSVFDRITENLADAARAAGGDDPERYSALGQEFHELLIEGADNAKLRTHHQTLMNQLANARLATTSSLNRPGRIADSVEEHRRVLDSILARDGDSAEHLMREHVRASRRALIAGLSASVDVELRHR